MTTARIYYQLKPSQYWEYAKEHFNLKKIQLTWDFIDTVCCAGFEWGSILTDIFIEESAIINPGTFTAGLAIGMVLAYCEFLAHRAQNNLIDPDENDSKLIKYLDKKIELSFSQKAIIAMETITHTTEKANGVTQALRLAVTAAANHYPTLATYERAAKGLVHVAALTGAFFGSGQEAKNIEIAFKQQNQLEHARSTKNK